MLFVLEVISENDIEDVGKLLFGRALRLKVVLYVLDRLEHADADGGAFFQSEAADAVSYGASAVTSELKRLIDLGMLSQMEPIAGSRRLYYAPRRESDLWDGVRAVRDALVERSGESKAEAM